jgi:peptidyl-prolyl cis-trans isomerase A (cyclophilin A)
VNRSTRSIAAALTALIAAAAVVACERTPQQTQTSGGAGVSSAANAPAGSTGAAAAAPDSFLVAFQTNKGRFVVQAVRAWAPKGVDRFHMLVNEKFYDRAKFFRVLPDFMAQFGIAGDPKVDAAWKDNVITDDPVAQSNRRGFLSYATGGPNTRSTQLFINTRDNQRLDGAGFSPFARVVQGMNVVDSLYTGYGEGAPGGGGPEQGRIHEQGNAYLNRYFPKLDSIISARVVRSAKD